MVESIGNDESVISQSRSFSVSKLAPVIKIDSVLTNSTFNDDFTVSGVALNLSGVKSVKILVDGSSTLQTINFTLNKFMEKYPNIKVDVIHNAGQILC